MEIQAGLGPFPLQGFDEKGRSVMQGKQMMMQMTVGDITATIGVEIVGYSPDLADDMGVQLRKMIAGGMEEAAGWGLFPGEWDGEVGAEESDE